MQSAAGKVLVALYSATENRRLRNDLERLSTEFSENDVRTILETVHTGAVIGRYAIESARRRDELPVKHFGYLLQELWAQADRTLGTVSVAASYLDASIVSIAAFSPSELDRQAAESKRGPRRDTLDRALAGPQTERLVRIGRRVAEVAGYRSHIYATRAQRPWTALDNLEATLREGFSFEPFLAAEAVNQSSRRVTELIADGPRIERGAEAMARSARANRPGPPADQDTEARPEWVWPPETEGPYLSHSLEPFQPPEAEEEGGRYLVRYGTDREPTTRSGSLDFLPSPDPANRLHYGTCVVNIPVGHRFGSVATSWWRRWMIGGGDDRLKLEAILPAQGEMEFVGQLDQALDDVEDSENTILIYIHGYNTTFRQAAIRTAQMGFDLKVDGATAFFSWPSAGRKLAYAKDAATIEASEARFVDFVSVLATRTQATKVHLIVHSMGNRLVARSIGVLEPILQRSGVSLGAIVLAAPDIDVRLFLGLAAAYPNIGAHTTMYVSRADKALALSAAIWRTPRAGFTPPITVAPGIDTVDVTDIDVSRLGHGYYAAAHPVLYDIREVLNGQYNPGARLRLREVVSGTNRYWRIAT
jgi:esterase/lipase superfamily enzyme